MYERFSRENENTGFIWTGITRVKDTDAGEKLLYSQTWPAQFQTKEQGIVEATSIGNGFGVCVKRECIETIGLYDESLLYGQDTEFLFRLVKHFEFGTIPEILVKIHHHNNLQLTDTRNTLVRLELRKKILHTHKDLLAVYPRAYYVHYQRVVEWSYFLLFGCFHILVYPQ